VSNVWALTRREVQSYFASPVAYVVLGLFTLIFGFLFYAYLDSFSQRSLGQSLPGAPEVLNLNQDMIRWLLGDTSWLLVFLLPMLTMRSLSEELRSGTIELLLTSPLTDFQIVAGKFLGAIVLYVAMLALTFLHMGLLFLFGDPEWKALAVGYLGLFLLGSALISLGIAFSSLSRNQIVAGLLSLSAFLFLGFFQSADNWAGRAAGFFTYLSATEHIEPFVKGVVDSRDVVYYLSFIGLGLLLAKQSVESLRWRG
jgi:gliding motility-associated transport system permease protein